MVARSSSKETSSEKRDFRIHKDILWSIIQQQAGTLGKAILELVMNAIDANSSRVDIEIKSESVSVSDDGKGFGSRKEIEEFFETFGTPHKEGDATYGRFRMGRGQIMAFSRNVWTSGVFRMDVDIKNEGLNYVLETLPKSRSFKGCRIDAKLYDPLSASQAVSLFDSLRSLCRYTPVPVFVNGERISLDLKKEKWNFEDEDAYYLFRQSRALEIYNLGVHVTTDHRCEYGVGGVVVSKRQLNVNFARNDIIAAKCAVWKRIASVLKKNAKDREEKKPVQDESWRKMSLMNIISGNFDDLADYLEGLSSLKVFTDYSGKHYSLESMRSAVTARAGRMVIVQDYGLKADRVHQKGLAFVVSPKTFDRASWVDFKEILRRISGNVQRFMESHPVSHNRWDPIRHRGEASLTMIEKLVSSMTNLDVVSASISDEHDIVDEKDLNKEEKIMLRVIKDNAASVAWALDMKTRDIRVCRSETVLGYTDGSAYIFVERGFLKLSHYGSSGVFAAFDKIKSLLVHEYLHDSDDSTGHGHPAEFYERFHEAMFNERLAGFSAACVKGWFAARRRAGIAMKFSDKEAANALFVETEEKVA